LPAWAEGVLSDRTQGRAASPEDLGVAVSAHLSRLAPFVLCAEDLHDAAPEEATFLYQLALAVRRVRGVGLVVTSRRDPGSAFVNVRVPPLTYEESSELLQTEAGAALPNPFRQWVHARAAGNPLFTKEFLRYLVRQGYLWSDGARWRWREPPDGRLPTTVEALVAQHLVVAKGTGAQRLTLEARALLPAGCGFDAWRTAAGLSQAGLQTAIRELRQLGIFEGDDFAHPLFREVTLRTVEPEARRELARRALGALKDRPGLAAQLVEAADLEDDAAVGLLVLAADQCPERLHAARFRAQAAERAVGVKRGSLALQAAEDLEDFDLPEAARLVTLALHTPQAQADTARVYARLLGRQGRTSALDAVLDSLPKSLLKRIDPDALSITMHNAAEDHQAAYALWEATPRLHASAEPVLLRAVAASALATGRMSEARALIAEGLTLASGDGLRSEFLSLKALVAFHEGDYALAEGASREVLASPALDDAPRRRSTALLNRAAFLRMLGDYAAMGKCLEECLELRRNGGDGQGYAFALAALAELRIEQGRFDEAEDALTEAITTLEFYGASRFLVNAHAIASSLYTAMATATTGALALAHAEQALSMARDSGNPRVVREILFDTSVANTRSGNAVRGLDLALEAHGVAGVAGDSPHDAARSHWAAGLAHEALGRRADALAELSRALELSRKLGVVLDAHKIGLEVDRLNGDATGARAHVTWFEERGLKHGADLARRYFPELSPTPEPFAVAECLLETLGPLRVVRGPDVRQVRGEKRISLLALLVEARLAGSAHVSKLELLDALYPGQDEAKASAGLKELIHALRADLGPGLVTTTPTGYTLGECVTDAELFLAGGDTRLWRGPYLGGRLTLGHGSNTLYGRLLQAVGSLSASEAREAARLGGILVVADPYDARHLELYLRALRAAGDTARLEHEYAAAQERMREIGEELPAAWQQLVGPG